MTTTEVSALGLLGSFVGNDGRFWIDGATDDQIADAIAILDPGAPTRRHWLGRARGYSKTTDAAAITLAAMAAGVIPAGENGYACAADEAQAQLLIRAARGFVRDTPGLDQLFTIERSRIHGPHETTVTVIPSDAPSAYGLIGHWWIIDELCQWPDTPATRDFYDAVSTTWPKVPGCRVVIITTAGDPAHFSRRIYDHARDSHRWHVSDLHGPPPWLDPIDIAAERQRLTPSTYRRLWLNEWAEPEDRLVRPEDLQACTAHGTDPLPYQATHRPYLITVDIGLTADSTAVVVSHRANGTEDRPVVIDRVQAWTGTRTQPVSLEEVTAHLALLSNDYGHAEILIDPYQAAHLTERLRSKGIKITEYTFTPASNSHLALSLHLAIRDRAIRLPDHPQLADELLHIQLRETNPGVWRIDHQPGRHDDMAITVAMATWWHQHHNTHRPVPIVGPSGATRESPWRQFDHPGSGFDRW